MPLGYNGGASSFDPSGLEGQLNALSGDVFDAQFFEASCLPEDEIYDAVFISGPGTVSRGHVSSINSSDVVGFIQNKIDPSNCIVQTRGLLEGFSALDEGENYYLYNSGDIVKLPTIISEDWNVIPVGVGYSSDMFYINLGRRPYIIR